jgi:hypothetical protein
MADSNKAENPQYTERMLDWDAMLHSFRVASARSILDMREMERHQNVRANIRWLTDDERPLALVFVSHRWETLSHPDPSGRQLKAIQQFLRRLCLCVEAMLVPRDERLALVSSLANEGALQAEEVARRMLGFGPHSDGNVCVGGFEARQIVREKFNSYSSDREAFRNWLTRRVGVWLDYTCMPQKPLSMEEQLEFRRSLMALDSLVISSTVLALRQPGDDYSVRGWCAAEFFLASALSFSRGLFMDVQRLEREQEVLVPEAPEVRDGMEVMIKSYEQDFRAFRNACQLWSSSEPPMIDITPPDAWSSYRSLQGSSFCTAEQDPNPFRRVLESVRSIETSLIHNWMMSEKPRTFNFGGDVRQVMQNVGLRTSEASDAIYLGLLIACHGWIDALKPLFRTCLRVYLEQMGADAVQSGHAFRPALQVTLHPPDQHFRALLMKVSPHSATTWHSRLSSRHYSDSRERIVVEEVRAILNENPLEFTFVQSTDEMLKAKQIDNLFP